VFIGLSPGYAPDLFSYLFGNILTVTSVDLIIMLILDLVIIMVVFLFYKEFLALSFDDEFATVVGVPTVKLYFLLLCLIALTIVVLMKVVGIIMIIALLTIPAAISKQYTSNLKKMIFISILLSAIFGLGGLWLSYQLNLASGATIVIVSGIGFILSWFGKQ
jgi:zinc transport system permease protein